MKNMKWIIPLAVVVVLLMVALPAAADDPFGGPPSKTSGNGGTTWGAIYVGGTWDNKCDGQYTNPNTFSYATGVVSSKQYDCYVTNWSPKETIPGGGNALWFKFDTVKSRDVQVYVDDTPKWGAAYRYFDTSTCKVNGTGDCDKSDNLLRIGIDTSALAKQYYAVDDRYDFAPGNKASINGFIGRIYGPDNMRPNYFFPTPNNGLLTTRSASTVRVGQTQGSYGGYGRGFCSELCWGDYGEGGNVNYVYMQPGDEIKAGDGNTHLLFYPVHTDGWVYIKVYNYMYWDNDMMMGTRYTPDGKYDFPSANNPYPFNP